MIIFQITLTQPMIQHLAVLKRQKDFGVAAFENLRWDRLYVTTAASIIRQGLATHEKPLNNDYLSTGVYKFKDKKRKYPYEITEKGEAALRLVAFELEDFISQVRLESLPPGVHGEYYQINDTAGHVGLKTHKGQPIDDTGRLQDGSKVVRRRK